jgi:hypothetical protein
MLSLDQAKELQRKVERALDVIASLKKENATLRASLSGYEGRIRELEVLIEGFRKDQSLIEQCIHRALEGLERIEDAAGGAPERPSGVASVPRAGLSQAKAVEEKVVDRSTGDDEPIDEAETGFDGASHEEPPVAPKPAGPELDIF